MSASVGKAKSNSAGGAIVLLIAAIALAAGGGKIHVGSHTVRPATTTPGDPCHGKENWEHIIKDGSAWLSCGNWRHILDSHPLGGASPDNVLRCITNVLAYGISGPARGGATEWSWRYVGGRAIVRVDEAGKIITAFTKGSPGNDWQACSDG